MKTQEINISNKTTNYSESLFLKQFVAAVKFTKLHLLHLDVGLPLNEEVKFFCVNRNITSYRQVYLDDRNLSDKIDLKKSVTFLIHGWFDNVYRRRFKEITSAWLKNVDGNICAVDWGRLANYDYIVIRKKNYLIVGKYLAKFIRKLFKRNGDYNKITLIGHSFGAHVAGVVGSLLNGKIGRIIGLDPAGIFFTHPYIINKKYRLDRSDARFVQIVHTAGQSIGSSLSAGHQDFYPNYGISPQPGCTHLFVEAALPGEILCSHYRAVEFFINSLNPENKFIGIKCDSGRSFHKGLCFNNPTDNIGIYSKRIYGDFYLSTSDRQPYCRGFSLKKLKS